jgi:hypothetical protein
MRSSDRTNSMTGWDHRRRSAYWHIGDFFILRFRSPTSERSGMRRTETGHWGMIVSDNELKSSRGAAQPPNDGAGRPGPINREIESDPQDFLFRQVGDIVKRVNRGQIIHRRHGLHRVRERLQALEELADLCRARRESRGSSSASPVATATIHEQPCLRHRRPRARGAQLPDPLMRSAATSMDTDARKLLWDGNGGQKWGRVQVANGGFALSNERFKAEIAAMLGRRAERRRNRFSASAADH